MDKFWKFVYLFLGLSIVVLIITHAKGFATSAGTLFTGLNGLGTTLTGASIKGGT